MHFNSLLGYIQKHSLPKSKTSVKAPVNTFTVEMEMITESLYVWLDNCDVVDHIECSHLIKGVAHNVSITVSTLDGLFELVEVE